MSEHGEKTFAKEISQHVNDLLKPNPWIFWGDLLATAAIGYPCLAAWLLLDIASPWAWVGYLCGALALYRAGMFIHEIAHFRRGTFGHFRFGWNVIAGIPMLTPSFLYAEHKTHHTNHSYGTDGDAEYYPVGRGPVGLLVWFVGQGIFVPIFAVIRFAFLTPLSMLHPKLRELVWQKASGLTQNNPKFRRPWPEGKQWFWWSLQEFACFAYCWGFVVLIYFGIVPAIWLLKIYAFFGFVTTLSMARALASHLYVNEGDEMSYVNQMFDSTTIPGHPLLTELWAPLGQRYHALHHLIPSIPYHALGTAHRRLMKALPEDSPYRKTIRNGLWHALSEVWVQASELARSRRMAEQS